MERSILIDMATNIAREKYLKYGEQGLSENEKQLLKYQSQQIGQQSLDAVINFGTGAVGKYAAKTARKVEQLAQDALSKQTPNTIEKILYNTPVNNQSFNATSSIDDLLAKYTNKASNAFKPVYEEGSRYASNLLMPNGLPRTLSNANAVNQYGGNIISGIAESSKLAGGLASVLGGVVATNYGLDQVFNNNENSSTNYVNKDNDAHNILSAMKVVSKKIANKESLNKSDKELISLVSSNIKHPYDTIDNSISPQEMRNIDSNLFVGNYTNIPINEVGPTMLNVPLSHAQYQNEKLPIPQQARYSQYSGDVKPKAPEYWSAKATDYVNRSTGLNMSHEDRVSLGVEMFGNDYRGSLEQNNQLIAMLNKVNKFRPLENHHTRPYENEN